MHKEPKDIVIDTNIFLHAGDSDNKCHKPSFWLITSMLENEVLLCVDRGYDWDINKNKSIMFREYLKKLKFGDLGHAVLGKLGSDNRIHEKNKFPEQKRKKIITQNIKNKHDRVFVGVTCNSDDCIFITQDFEDFQKNKRKLLKRKLSIQINCSDQLFRPRNCKKVC